MQKGHRRQPSIISGEGIVYEVHPPPPLQQETRPTSPSSSSSSDGSLSPLVSPSQRSSWSSCPSPSSSVVLSSSSTPIFLLTVGMSISAVIVAVLVGIIFDYDDLFNYFWVCEKVFLPAFSRLINLRLERVVWHVLVLFSLPLRSFVHFQYYCAFTWRLLKSPSRFSSLLLFAFTVSGCFEMAFLALLTVVGEREDGYFHMYFFIAFVISTLIYMGTNIALSHRHLCLTRRQYLGWCLRLGCFVLVLVVLPLLSVAFTLFFTYCVKHAYDTFALLEYVAISFIISFHSSCLYDLSSFTVVYYVHDFPAPPLPPLH